MMFFYVSGLKRERLFSLGLLMLITVFSYAPHAIGQQVGVSLKLHGVAIPNNSLVDINDLLYSTPNDPEPTNMNGLHDQALLCVTDLVDCCESPKTVRGDWYYPDGSVVPFTNDRIYYHSTFLKNRGPNEVGINGQQVYGSVRLFRRWSKPPGRGRFRCELPSAAHPNVSLTLYVNIVDFGNSPHPVILSTPGPSFAGFAFSLKCSATLVTPIPLPTDVPCPTIEWFYGPNDNASLPSGVTPTSKLNFSGHTFISTLQFSPVLNESHAGKYTCRLGAGQLISSRIVSTDVDIFQISTSGVPVIGQNSYTLTCKALVADHLCPFISYQWTKENGTVMQPESHILSFSPLRLSDAGQYTCQVTVCSYRLNGETTVVKSHEIRLQIPAPTFVILSSNTANPVWPFGSAVNLTCIVHVELGPAVDVPVILTTKLAGPDGFTAINTSQPNMGDTSTTFYTSKVVFSSFGREQSGVYTCSAVLSSLSTNLYLTDSNATSESTHVTIGVHLMLRNQFIVNNSQINVRSIGKTSDNPNGALQCITDRKPCCFSQNPRLGEWYLPNGALVQENTSTTAFYRNRGDDGEVYINRPTDVTSPIGRFCCEIPDATDTNQTLCVIIEWVSITTFGSPIASENYSLECSAGGLVAAFEWLGPPDGMTPVANSSSLIISSNPSTSQLQFQPLQQSHNGLYSCHAQTNEDALLSQPTEIHVKAPSISVEINESTRGIAGESFSLICRTIGAENLNPSVTYRWTKSSSSGQIQVGTNSNTLSFTPVRLSDAANYSCMVTIASGYLTANIIAMVSQNIRIQIPSSSVTLTSNVANSLQIVGSDVMLTCTVELNPEILGSEIFLLVVNAQLSRDSTLLTLMGPTVTGTTLSYTTTLNSFERSDFGNYTCAAAIRPQPNSIYLTGDDVLSETLNIKPAISSPVNVRATQSSSSAPVEVSWSPPTDQGDFNITGYRIFYGSGQNISIPSVVITSVSFKVDENYDGHTVLLRSESGQIYSEHVNVTVERDMAECHYNCSREIGTTVGVMVTVLVVAMIAFITVVLCWCKKKSSDSVEKDLTVSTNVAYKEVTKEDESVYEDIETILKSSASDQWTEGNKEASYKSVSSKLAASEYIDKDDAVFVVRQQMATVSK